VLVVRTGGDWRNVDFDCRSITSRWSILVAPLYRCPLAPQDQGTLGLANIADIAGPEKFWAYQRAREKANAEKIKASRRARTEKQRLRLGCDHARVARLKKYGLTPHAYDEMVARQKGLCAICGLPPIGQRGKDMLHVDHDHDTGVVRGLLCHMCNKALGLFKDRSGNLWMAHKYLRKHGK